MSAECGKCGKCGTDIVYPEGTWPVGECPVCDMRVTDDMVERAARKLAYEFGYEEVFEREIETNYTPDYWRAVAREVLAAAFSTEESRDAT